MSNHTIPFPAPGPDCASFADQLPLFGEGVLDDQTQNQLRQHVGTCAYCQAQVATDTRIAGVFRRYFELPAVHPFSLEELMQITDNDKRPPSTRLPVPSALPTGRPRPLRPGRVTTIAAVALIAAVVA